MRILFAYSFVLYFLGKSKDFVEVVHKMLVKLTLVFYFTNILRAAFALIFLHQKITKPNCTKKAQVKC